MIHLGFFFDPSWFFLGSISDPNRTHNRIENRSQIGPRIGLIIGHKSDPTSDRKSDPNRTQHRLENRRQIGPNIGLKIGPKSDGRSRGKNQLSKCVVFIKVLFSLRRNYRFLKTHIFFLPNFKAIFTPILARRLIRLWIRFGSDFRSDFRSDFGAAFDPSLGPNFDPVLGPIWDRFSIRIRVRVWSDLGCFFLIHPGFVFD